LGLVLIHKIMQLHNAKIRYSSEGDDFNIFTLEFSLLEEAESEIAFKESSAQRANDS
jgi:hypothetical protein